MSAGQEAAMDIAVGESLRVHGRKGIRVHCVRGQVWLTQLGVLDDVFLPGGTSYTSRGHGLIVVGAWKEPSAIRVHTEPASGWLSASGVRVESGEQLERGARRMRALALATVCNWALDAWRGTWRRLGASVRLETTAADIEARERTPEWHRTRRSRTTWGAGPTDPT